METKTNMYEAKFLLLSIILPAISLVNYQLYLLYSDISLYLYLLISLFIILSNKKILRFNFYYFIVLFLALALSLLINKGGFGSFLTFIVPILLLYSFESFQVTYKNERQIRFVSIIAIFILFIYSFFYASNWWYYRFNGINPNIMGCYVGLYYMLWYSFFDQKKHKLLNIFVFFISMYSLINYESRGVMITVIIFILVNYCVSLFTNSKFVKHTKKIIFYLMISLIILGTLFPLMYLNFYNTNLDLTIFGKSLFTGRELIWIDLLKMLDKNQINWIFGLGSNVLLYGNESAHNIYFGIIAAFGLVGFIIYYYFILHKVRNVDMGAWKNPRIRKLMLMFIIYTLFLGFSEITTLYSPNYGLIYGCFGLALSYNKMFMKGKNS